MSANGIASQFCGLVELRSILQSTESASAAKARVAMVPISPEKTLVPPVIGASKTSLPRWVTVRPVAGSTKYMCRPRVGQQRWKFDAAEAVRLSAVSPRPFLVGVMIAASAAFATPFGYQTNVLVYQMGGYNYLDFVKVGIPLNIITWAAAVIAIQIYFPF